MIRYLILLPFQLLYYIGVGFGFFIDIFLIPAQWVCCGLCGFVSELLKKENK